MAHHTAGKKIYLVSDVVNDTWLPKRVSYIAHIWLNAIQVFVRAPVELRRVLSDRWQLDNSKYYELGYVSGVMDNGLQLFIGKSSFNSS